MTRETWVSTDDRGTQRRLVVDFDSNGVARITRQALTDILVLAGMRQSFEVDACDITRDRWCANHSTGEGPAYCPGQP